MVKSAPASSLDDNYQMPVEGAIATMQPIDLVSFDKPTNTIRDEREFTIEDARRIRKDPTVHLARLLSVAPILAANWSVENDDDANPKAVDFVSKFRKFRSFIVKEAAFGMMDYGWRGMEAVWALENGYLAIEDFISLLPDITKVTPDTVGNFLGFRQDFTDYSGKERTNIIQGKAKAILFNQRQEGTNYYGQADLEIIEDTKNRYDFANQIAEQYDTKSAGAVWVIEYPVGKTLLNGVMTENSDIARSLLSSIKSNGGITIPTAVQGAIGNLVQGATANSLANPNGWQIKLMESTGSSSAHLLSRMQHLETLMVRGVGLPERSLLEGKHGTKAEAKVHTDVALTSAIDRSDYIIGMVNNGPVNAGLFLNFGPDQIGKVRLIAEPIGDDEKAFLREVYMKILGSAEASLLDLENVDMATVREITGVPSITSDAVQERRLDKFRSDLSNVEGDDT